MCMHFVFTELDQEDTIGLLMMSKTCDGFRSWDLRTAEMQLQT